MPSNINPGVAANKDTPIMPIINKKSISTVLIREDAIEGMGSIGASGLSKSLCTSMVDALITSESTNAQS